MTSRYWACWVLVAALLTPYALHAGEASEDSQAAKPLDSGTAVIRSNDRKSTDGNAIRCKKIQVTGTHFPRRVCRKQSEWEAMRLAALEVMKQSGRQAEAQTRNQRYGL